MHVLDGKHDCGQRTHTRRNRHELRYQRHGTEYNDRTEHMNRQLALGACPRIRRHRVPSAAGADARRRDAGDVGVHRRGAPTPQMPLRLGRCADPDPPEPAGNWVCVAAQPHGACAALTEFPLKVILAGRFIRGKSFVIRHRDAIRKMVVIRALAAMVVYGLIAAAPEPD